MNLNYLKTFGSFVTMHPAPMWVDQKSLQCFGWKELDSRSPVWWELLAISWRSSFSIGSASITFSIRFVFFYVTKTRESLDQIKVALKIFAHSRKLAKNPAKLHFPMKLSSFNESVKMFGTSFFNANKTRKMFQNQYKNVPSMTCLNFENVSL